MFALYSIGTVIERVAGSLRFAAIYFASLAGGALFAILFSSPFASTVGASGAIFGLFGAFVFLQLSRGMNPWSSGIMSTIGLNLAITFLIPGISKGGHVGGLLLGVLLGWVMFGRSRQEAVQRERLATTLSALTFALGLFLCVATVFAAHYVVENGPLLSLT
jgi:membrane associated rhomboid family serine protease